MGTQNFTRFHPPETLGEADSGTAHHLPVVGIEGFEDSAVNIFELLRFDEDAVNSIIDGENRPPERPAITGLPQATASMNTVPKPSTDRAFFPTPSTSRLGMAKTSQRL